MLIIVAVMKLLVSAMVIIASESDTKNIEAWASFRESNAASSILLMLVKNGFTRRLYF
jgi:hypothetical protein